VKLWQNRAKYDRGKPMLSWVVTIAYHHAISELRRRGRQALVGLDLPNDNRRDPTDNRTGPEPDTDEYSDYLFEAIDELSEELREVFLLRIEGMPNQDIADIIGVTDGEVSRRWKEALEQIRAIVGERFEELPAATRGETEEVFRRLQRRHERALDTAAFRMAKLRVTLDANGRLAGFTAAATDEDGLVVDQLRGVLPLYLLGQGVGLEHADAVHKAVEVHLQARRRAEAATTAPAARLPFRMTLARVLEDYCDSRQIPQIPADGPARLLSRFLSLEPDGPEWVAHMKEWAEKGLLQCPEDLVKRELWPDRLKKVQPFAERMQVLHDYLLPVLETKNRILG
jgi:RNA polymerase sigma-70 factor (ECF subfamily)